MFMSRLVLSVKDVSLSVSHWKSYGHELYLKGVLSKPNLHRM